jgi:hypothetical protein
LGSLVSPPALDLRAQPQLDTPFTEVHNWARHVLIAALVEAYAVAMGELEDVGDVLCVD